MAEREPDLYSVHLSTARTWRGGENQIWLLARGLQQRGQKALVLAPPGAPLLERCAAAGVPARGFSFCCELDPSGIGRLCALLRRERPDILHLHDGHAVLPGQLAAYWSRQPQLRVVAHRRTAFALKGRWKYGRGVDRIIAISAAVRDMLLAAGISAVKIAVVYSGLEFAPAVPDSAGRNGTSGQAALALRQKLGLPDDALLVGHAAALTAEKRQRDMVAAVARANEILKGAGSAGVHLLIAGSGDQEEALRHEARRRGVESQVHLLGFLQDVSPLWAASAVALYASEAEGLCTGLIEAQGAGVPAVITRAGGMVEVVAADESGLVVAVGDVEGLAAALAKLARDPALRQRLGQAAARLARRKFSSEAMVDGVLRVYRETAGC